MTYRVACWGMGNLGKVAVRAVSRRPDLELVGAGVHNPEKAGLDVGTHAGLEPLGLPMTADLDALIALKPDCLVYGGVSDARDPEMIPRLARFLEAGTNVVTASCYGLLHPPSQRPAHRQALEAATAKGRSSAYTVGLEPGIAEDLALVLTTMSETVRSIRVQELWSYDHIATAHTIFTAMGLGMPVDYQPHVANRDWILGIMAGSMHKIAERLGEKIDEFRYDVDKVIAPRTIEVAAGTIEAGTVGAVRFVITGVVGGRDAIVIEHVNRVAEEVAPDWPAAARNGAYRVIIEGSPDMVCEFTLGGANTFGSHGSLATAMMMVNAVPYVCEARPGLLTPSDLPLTTPKHVFEEGQAA